MSSGNTTIKMDFHGKLLISDDGRLIFIYEEPKGCVLFFFRKAKTHTVVIDPNTKMITVEERKISFAEINKVETFFIHEQPSMEVVGFHIVLKTDEKIRLGGSMISRQGSITPEGYTKISKLLDEVIKSD